MPAKFQLKPDSDKFLTFDVLRFFAAALIVFHHWKTQLLLPSPWLIWLDRLTTFQFGVDLFFIISGFIIFHVYSNKLTTMEQYLKYMRRRVARLYPLHLLTLLLVLVFGYAFHDRAVHPELYRSGAFCANLFMVNAWWPHTQLSFNFAAWSISVEVFCYIVFPLVLWGCRGKVGLPMLLALMSVLLLLCKPRYLGGFDAFPLLRGIVAFTFGMGLYRLRARLPRVPAPGTMLISLFILLTAFSEAGIDPGRLYAFPYLIAVTAATADVHRSISNTARLLAPLGQLTYSIYMWHIPVAYLFYLLPSITHSALLHNTLIGANLILLTAVSYASLRWIETPARHWLSGSDGKKRLSTQDTRIAQDFAP
jgi:peptidoglycan/LPS O-acetylase OafA/YrhL